jgi:hypothetical protein
MVRTLEASLRVARSIAMSEEHFTRLAQEAVARAMRGSNDKARAFVDSIYTWNLRAWRSERPAITGLERQVETLRQITIMRALLMKRVERSTVAFVNGEPNPDIKPDLNRAAFYARDQAGNIYHGSAKAQASSEGAIGYIWVRTTSASPRDFHLDRVDNFYEFGELPDEPGVLPNCKCSMEPVYPGKPR